MTEQLGKLIMTISKQVMATRKAEGAIARKLVRTCCLPFPFTVHFVDVDSLL